MLGKASASLTPFNRKPNEAWQAVRPAITGKTYPIFLNHRGPVELLLTWIRDHPGWAGIAGGVLIGFFPSVWAGHLGNRWTERRNKKTLQGKQKEFIDGLSAVTETFITTEPNNTEVAERRRIVGDEVKRLSQRLFDQSYPEIEASGLRVLNTQNFPANGATANIKRLLAQRGNALTAGCH